MEPITCTIVWNGTPETLPLASAAYHSGQGLVDRLLEDARYSDDGVTLHTFPYEQMNLYVHKVERNYKRYQELYT